MKNLMAYLQNQQMPQSFQAREMAHMANNPIHEQHIAKAFALKQPKTKIKAPQPSPQPGSPWLAMGVPK